MKQIILDYFQDNYLPFYEKYLTDLKHSAGDEHKSLCCFHEEKNPSLFINIKTGQYHCQGCKAGGDFFKFYAQLNGLNGNFPAVLKGIANDFGITHSPLSKKDYDKIEKQKQQRRQLKRQKQRERDLAYTLAFLIRSAYKSLESISPDNIDEFGDTLDSLPRWEYCHETLCSGSDTERQQCCRELTKMPTIKRNTLFRSDFNFSQWLRGSLNG